MVFLRLTHAFAAIAGLSGLGAVLSAPLEAAQASSNTTVDLFSRGAPSGPHFVIYGDKYVSGVTGPPPASQIKGFNVFALSFLLTEGPADKATEWTQLSASKRTAIKKEYAAAGIKLIVSAFGATDAPTTKGADPIATADKMAAWVKQYDLDGIDVDYEDFDAMSGGKAEDWISSFTKQLRSHLPQGQYLLTHAPVAPWFAPGKYDNGAYLKVHKNVGDLIDWYNVQFYNQGANEYTTCDGLLTASSDTWPKTAVFQIAGSGVPLSKIVIGKPADGSEASDGTMSTSQLAQCVQQAKGKGWNAGVMVWEFPTAGSSWIKSVRGSAFPV
ncbi:glycoside hydrolase family 18 protein [Lyophyllum atratum]|nr:glycoside hydrolase family 18 protein [Lyophyllum atratum]